MSQAEHIYQISLLWLHLTRLNSPLTSVSNRAKIGVRQDTIKRLMGYSTEQTAVVVATTDTGTGKDAWANLRIMVLDGLDSQNSKRSYARSLDNFRDWYDQHAGGAGLSKTLVGAYAERLKRLGLAASTVNVRLTAVRRLAAELADNGALDPGVAMAIGRVKGAKLAGGKVGNWLSATQAEQLLGLPNLETLKGKRDRTILAVMIGCGLRRAEVAALTCDHIQQRDGRWCVLDLTGKGGRVRTVPMPAWAKVAIDEWIVAAKISSGRLFRGMNHGRIGNAGLDPHNIRQLVRLYGARIGVPELAPHDLRRTFAKLAYKGKAPLEQIQLSLGHSSITTTERYLGTKQNLQDAPCDHLGLSV